MKAIIYITFNAQNLKLFMDMPPQTSLTFACHHVITAVTADWQFISFCINETLLLVRLPRFQGEKNQEKKVPFQKKVLKKQELKCHLVHCSTQRQDC